MDTLTSDQLQEAAGLLDLLSDEVAVIEASLGSLESTPDENSAVAALASLRQFRIWTADPAANFYTLPAREPDKDAYLLRLPMGLQPAPGAKFSRIECSVEFAASACAWSPQLVAVFPEHRFRVLLEYERELEVGIAEDLAWSLPNLEALASLPAEVKLELATKFAARAQVRVPPASYRLITTDIHATGIGSRAFWRIDSPKLDEAPAVDFMMIIQTPKGCSEFAVEITYAAYPSFSWLAARLRDLFDKLSEGLKAVLRKSDEPREGARGLPIGRRLEPITLRTANAMSLVDRG